MTNPGSDFIFRGLRGLRGTRRDLECNKEMFFWHKVQVSIVKTLEKNESNVRFGFYGTYRMLGN
jgi:hypothetical protein